MAQEGGIRRMWDALCAWFYPSMTDRNLPWGVMHAIAEHRGLLYARELNMLDAPHIDLLVYLIAKLPHGDREAQLLFLETVFAHAEDVESLMVLARLIIARTPQERSVEAMKILQLHRQGFELWDALYQGAAYRVAQGDDADLVLVAYAPLVGFRCFAQALRDTGRSIYLISDKLIADQSADFCGYQFAWHDGIPLCTVVPKDHAWPSRLVVVEDTIKRGSTMRAVCDFIKGVRPDVSIAEIVLARTQPIT